MQQLRSWGGRYQQDHLHGHRCAVRAVKLLPSHNLLATGSLDKTVRLWDLQAGRPLAVSRPHGGTVRCLALDSFALASGCSDHIVRVWSSCLTPPASCASRRTLPHRATSCNSSSAKASGCSTDSPVAVTPSDVTSSDEDDSGSHRPMQPPGDLDEAGATTPSRQRQLFDVASAPAHCLTGHRGPVSALCLTPEALYSGSWDYTVRVWSREEGENGPGFQCVNVLGYDDWVGSVTARGGHLLVSAGVEVLVHDLGTGQVLRKFQNLHEGHVNCLEGSHSGRMLFTGSGDGLVLAHDLRMRDPTSVLWHFNAGVHSLALEDPWLACSAADGGVVLLNTEAALGRMPGGSQYRAGCRSSSRGPAAAWTPGSGAGGRGAGGRHSLGANCRQLAAAGGPAYSVDLVEQWLAAGSECTTVRVWDFTGAAEAAERAAIARAMRHSSKARRQASQMQRQQQQRQQQQQEEEVVEQEEEDEEEEEEEVALGMVELKLDASAVSVSQHARLGTSGPASSRSVERNPMPQPSTGRDGVLCAQLHLREAPGPVGAAAAILSRPHPTPAGLPQGIGSGAAIVSGREERAAPEGQHWGARDHYGHATAHRPHWGQLLGTPPPRPPPPPPRQQQQATSQAHYPTPWLPAAPQALRSDGHRQSLPLAQQQRGGGLAAMDPQLQHHLLPPPHRHHQLSSSPPLQSHPSTAVWAAQLSRHSLDSQGPRHSSRQAQYLPAHNPTRSAPAQPRQAWAMQAVSASKVQPAVDKFKYRQVPRARNAKQRRQQRQQLEQQVQDC
ncbi:hypothetical protein QJQ45_010258 [Haematococcus lacustris]|nr:hypothetical protein QJQ45_010258 [Haematococcus lacustris]